MRYGKSEISSDHQHECPAFENREGWGSLGREAAGKEQTWGGWPRFAPVWITTKLAAPRFAVFEAWARCSRHQETFLIRNSAFWGWFTRTGPGSL
jgi:hypothetical protein